MLSFSAVTLCQQPGPAVSTQDNSAVVIGSITGLNAASMQATVKTDAGITVNLIFDAKTEFRRMRQEDKDLKNAIRINLADLNVGDRVLTRNKVNADKASPVSLVIVMTGADVTKKQERDQEEWQRRGIVGVISRLDPATHEITLRMRANPSPREIIVAAGERTRFRRYAPDSVKFSDARESSFGDLQVGDQFRALGDQSSDGARFNPEQVISGSFRTLGGTVTTINPATNEITLSDIQTRKPLAISLSAEPLLRRVSPEVVQLFTAPEPNRQPDTGVTNGSATPATQGHKDLQTALEKSPPLKLTDLKAGDLVLITGTTAAPSSRITAIALFLGFDELLKKVQQRAEAARSAKQDLGGTGLPNGLGVP
jgi:hypothetical protein